METKFQTSFIPKKPLTTQETAHHAPSSTSILMLIGVLLFIISLGGAVLAYFGTSYFAKVQEDYKKDLAENEKRFNVPLIEDLKKANTKIDLARELLKNHLAVSEALTIVSALTAEKVHFTNFEFSAPEGFGKAGSTAGVFKISMKGVADSFNSIAFQSDVFGKSQKYGTNKVLKNPILSNMAVDQNGNVKFDFTAEVALPEISYEKVLKSTLQSEGQLPDPQSQ